MAETFATVEDVATRFRRELTEAETADAQLLLEGATAIVTVALGKDEEWVEDLVEVPGVLRIVTLALVVREMQNPGGLASVRKQIGSYSYARTFREAGGDLLLTKAERMLVRRAILGPLVGSARAESLADELYPEPS